MFLRRHTLAHPAFVLRALYFSHGAPPLFSKPDNCVQLIVHEYANAFTTALCRSSYPRKIDATRLSPFLDHLPGRTHFRTLPCALTSPLAYEKLVQIRPTFLACSLAAAHIRVVTHQ